MAGKKDFLGRGWAFPPSFNRKSGEAEMVEERVDIDQSLEILLSTSLGERVMQASYGCNLKDFQFEPMDASFIGLLKDMVKNAILYYEPRIKLESIKVTKSDGQDAIEGRVLISLDYLIRGTNSRFNFVYDFYTTEGAV